MKEVKHPLIYGDTNYKVSFKLIANLIKNDYISMSNYLAIGLSLCVYLLVYPCFCAYLYGCLCLCLYSCASSLFICLFVYFKASIILSLCP